jgi:hypothetical protein
MTISPADRRTSFRARLCSYVRIEYSLTDSVKYCGREVGSELAWGVAPFFFLSVLSLAAWPP